MRKLIPGISEKMLIQQLRQLEADGLILRNALPVVPLYVEYRLSEQGEALKGVLDAILLWARRNMEVAE